MQMQQSFVASENTLLVKPSAKGAQTPDVLQVKDDGKVQQSVTQQQIQTWELLSVLYSAIKDTSDIELNSRPSLVDMRRREGLSSWLQVVSWIPAF